MNFNETERRLLRRAIKMLRSDISDEQDSINRTSLSDRSRQEVGRLEDRLAQLETDYAALSRMEKELTP